MFSFYSCKCPRAGSESLTVQGWPDTCLSSAKPHFPSLPLPPTIGLNCLALRLSAFFPFAIVAGNGYIEGKELENFFQELEKARKGSGMVSPAPSPIVWDFLSS